MPEFDQNERLASAIGGDRSALAVLLVEHTPPLARRIGHQLALNSFADFGVEDVQQEVYIDVLRGISSFRPEESLGSERRSGQFAHIETVLGGL